jgi:hypothetical protein
MAAGDGERPNPVAPGDEVSGEPVLGGSRSGGEVIWGSMEDEKLTRRLVYDDTTWVGKRADDGTVRGQGRPIPGPGSTRATVWSSRRWRPGQTVDGECCHR